MANLRQVRARIRSVRNTQKITRAMQMVAGAKLRRAQGQLFQARPYVDRLEGLTRRFLETAPTLAHPLVERAWVSGASPAPAAVVLATSDTGLCGAYNERLLATARRLLAETPAPVVPVGRKGLSAARREGWMILAQFTELGGQVTVGLVEQLTSTLLAAYHEGRISWVQVVYTAFRSALSWRPTVETWLPIAPQASFREAERGGFPVTPLPAERRPDAAPDLYEPTPAEIAARLLPAYLTARMRRLLLEAVTSEHSARMVAMKAATDNAAEMIDTLTLLRNKVRQASITKEISEIVAGAEALKTD